VALGNGIQSSTSGGKTMVITEKIEKQMFQQQVGTGYLIIKKSPYELLQVERFIRRTDGMLCRIPDGTPVLPLTLDHEEE
jgi:hypothetical protein